MRELVVHIEGDQIIVNMIDTQLTLTYHVSPEGQLEEIKFWTVDGGDSEFRRIARQAAQFKARQLRDGSNFDTIMRADRSWLRAAT